jgi:hypothetical protein
MNIPKKTQLQLQMLDFKVQDEFLMLHPNLFNDQSIWEHICKSLNIDPKEYKDGVMVATMGVKKV